MYDERNVYLQSTASSKRSFVALVVFLNDFKLFCSLTGDGSLSVNFNNNTIKQLIITDLMGITYQINNYSGNSTNTIIDLSSSIRGCYFLRLTSCDNKNYFAKFIKN